MPCIWSNYMQNLIILTEQFCWNWACNVYFFQCKTEAEKMWMMCPEICQYPYFSLQVAVIIWISKSMVLLIIVAWGLSYLALLLLIPLFQFSKHWKRDCKGRKVNTFQSKNQWETFEKLESLIFLSAFRKSMTLGVGLFMYWT